MKYYFNKKIPFCNLNLCKINLTRDNLNKYQQKRLHNNGSLSNRHTDKENFYFKINY